MLNRKLKLPAKPVDPVTYVEPLASTVELPMDVTRRAHDLAEQATDAGLANGGKPAGIAAACLYQAANEAGVQVTQAELARAGDVTDITLRDRLGELQSLLD